jgi:hypothetical protein
MAVKPERGYNYNLAVSHPSAIAHSAKNDMLFSSGDSPELTTILSGEGFDDVKENRFYYYQ